MMDLLQSFLAGAVSFGFMWAGIIFLKYWRRSRDQLFFMFALAFLLLAVAQALLALLNVPVEDRTWVYLLRLSAFTLIAAGIIRKNW